MIRPFSAVPDLLKRARDAGLRIAIASSAKKDELEKYLDIASITKLVDATTSSDDVKESKPEPDIFEVVLKKLGIDGDGAVAIGDSRTTRRRRPRQRSAPSGYSAEASRRTASAKPDASKFIPDRLRCSPASTKPCRRNSTA